MPATKYKWNAWNAYKGLSQEEAGKAYIAEVNKYFAK